MPTTQLVSAEPSDRGTIERLIQLYLYDLSLPLSFPIDDDGRYEYTYLDRFWRHPYLIRDDDELAGFVLVTDWCPITGRRPCFFMAEFFVMRRYRRRGVASAACHQVFARHSGLWHAGVIERNQPGMAFWQPLLGGFDATATSVTHEGEAWRLFEFTVNSGAIG